ncbi:hypothetical protein IP81_16750 [Novosphingobium sp. AAP83]|uniref:UDP binding domain-containing protein n=1 Tax=Novosphingobium sp. AAP83 TaxID=1523425 RepID=UPI0006B9ACA7|nr:UDP binding domain-containing protein [Novosphingobium sp. AAP83]KPF89380.1 hypothetical protein IP81_16750 [Novosphingobium sp. AAP83]
MGFAFKENCPDVRNTRVIDVVSELNDLGANVDIFDPWVNLDLANEKNGVNFIQNPKQNEYDGIVIAVAHDLFKNMGAQKIRQFGRENSVVFDIKHLLPSDMVDIRL